MLDGVRHRIGEALQVVAARIINDPIPYPDRQRVPYSGATLARVTITPDTAVTVSAVWACLRYLTQTVGTFPWRAMSQGERGPEVAKSHPVDYLLYKRPNPEWTSFQFRETLLHWALRWGNGYAEIERDTVGRPINLWPLHPERVIPMRDEKGLYYHVQNYQGVAHEWVAMAPMDIFHVRGFGESPVGVNVIEYAAQSLGWARAAQLFGAAFFGNGASMGGIVINKKGLRPEGLRRQKAEFDKETRGPTKAGVTYFLDNDADYKQLAIDPDKAQFIQTQQHLVEEVCRWFGVPPHKIMHLLRATFANIEHQAIEVVTDSVAPWVKRFEDEADYKLFGPVNRNNYYTKMNMRAIMRGDMAARATFYKNMWSMGTYSPNHILELEDENTLGPDGDVHVMQGQMQTLEQIGQSPVLTPNSQVGKPPPTQSPPPSPSPEDTGMMDRLTMARLAALHRSEIRVDA